MSDNDCDYVKDMRARFEANKNQSHALMIEVLADNKRFIEYLNYLGICPHDGSPTAEEIVAMRIQTLERERDELQKLIPSAVDRPLNTAGYNEFNRISHLNTRYEQALRDIEGSAFDCGSLYQTAKEAAIWMNGRASEALGDLS